MATLVNTSQTDVYPLDHLAGRGKDADVALIFKKQMLTYADLRFRVAQLAAWLAQQISGKGARVAVWASKGELTCLMPLAAARAGLVYVPINPLLKHAQVAHILADSGAQILIATAARLDSLSGDELPQACRALRESDALLASSDWGSALDPSQCDPQSLATILYTSGSTGKPKGVMLSHANLWLGAQSVAAYLDLKPEDRVLAALPLSFDYGQNQLLSAWYAGASVAPLDYLAPRDVLKAVERYGITTLAAVPPLWVQLVGLEWPSEIAGSLKRLTNSGGALTVDLVRKMRSRFPEARVFAMYGLTEAFRSTYLDPEILDDNPTSMGKAIPYAEILVVNDAGEIAADNEEGELVHCGPLVAQGYWQDPERTEERFRPAPQGSAYGGIAVWSGDRVRRDGQGLHYFVGRRDAMIKSAGNRISPQEIEDAVLATGLVAEAVAFGVPDTLLGHAVHVVARGIDDGFGADELLRRLKADLPNFMLPKEVHWYAAMPLNPNGKVDRAKLYDDLLRKQSLQDVDQAEKRSSNLGE